METNTFSSIEWKRVGVDQREGKRVDETLLFSEEAHRNRKKFGRNGKREGKIREKEGIEESEGE